MSKINLPDKPNLEQYKKIAKSILRAWKNNVSVEIPWQGSSIAITPEHLRQKHPRLSGLSEHEARSVKVTLADVQFLIAREYGFESWAKFVGYIEGDHPLDSIDSDEYLDARNSLAVSVVKAIQEGDVERLNQLLEEQPNLAKARLRDAGGMARSLLHIATDWPGHFPRVAETISALVEAGAEIDAPFIGGPHSETPLHWAASSNDVEALNALLDAGANIEAKGAVIAGGTPLTDAVAFAQWKAAYRLVELGAQTSFDHEAALGMLEQIEERFVSTSSPKAEEINQAFWFACHGGQTNVAEYLLEKGADPNWLPTWEKKTPLEAADRNGFTDLAVWLRNLGTQEPANKSFSSIETKMAINIQGLCPLIQVFNMPRSLAFYRDILGFEVVQDSGNGDDSSWVWLRLNGSELMLNDQYEPGYVPSECPPDRIKWHKDTCLYFGCPDTDAAYEYLRLKGIECDQPKVAPYGMKQLYLKDPDGYEICFQWEAK